MDINFKKTTLFQNVHLCVHAVLGINIIYSFVSLQPQLFGFCNGVGVYCGVRALSLSTLQINVACKGFNYGSICFAL